jgi:uncharacterized membrane protein YadS
MNTRAAAWRGLFTTEDWWAVWLGFAVIAAVFSGAVAQVPEPPAWSGTDIFAGWSWELLGALGLLGAGLCALFTTGAACMDRGAWRAYPPAFLALFVFAAAAYAVSRERASEAYGFNDAFWALLLGLLISNTVGTPGWMRPAIRTEYYIKTGLVILGAEILLWKILAFGAYGLAIAWGVTPVVIVFMWLFGTRVLRIANKHLVMVIAASTSVCGVSAAIATAAACRAKKEDLTLAVGMTLLFTVAMMIVMPWCIKAAGMSDLIGGAWMGGTIDSTGAVAAAGASLGEEALAAATIVKMIQNVLIGAVAFCVALFWLASVERVEGARPSPAELWRRFPKFVLGFMAASLLASLVLSPLLGNATVNAMKGVSASARTWIFCLAFLSIGLESNFRELAARLSGGRPVVLYAVGQGFNLALTLLVAWLVLSGLLLPAPPSLAGP